MNQHDMNRRSLNSLIGAYIVMALCIISALAIAIYTSTIPEPSKKSRPKWSQEASDARSKNAAELKSALE